MISVVTPSFQQGHYLEETLRSVLLQGYPALQYGVVDGGSTDASRGVIEKYAPWLSYTVIEKDRGQADAINKGISRSTGEWFNWINSDDVLMPNALRTVGETSADWVAGRVFNVWEDGRREEGLQRFITLDALARLEAWYHQPGLWMRREMVTPLDSESHYVFDWMLYTRVLASQSVSIDYSDVVFAHFRMHDASKTVSQQSGFLTDNIRALTALAANPSTSARVRRVARRTARRLPVMRDVQAARDAPAPALHRMADVIRIACAGPSVPNLRFAVGALRQIAASALRTP